METPKLIKEHIKRQHTPRLSERKKKLFASQSNEKSPSNDEDGLNGIQPFKPFPSKTPKKKSHNEINLENLFSTKQVISFFQNDLEDNDNIEEHNGNVNDISEGDNVVNVTPARRSQRLRSRQQQQYERDAVNNGKESQNKSAKSETIKADDDQQQQQQLQKMFRKSMRLSSSSMEKDNDEMIVNETILETQDEEQEEEGEVSHGKTRSKKKRQHSVSFSESPKSKQLKEETTPPQMYAKSISTKSFYSAPKPTVKTPISKGKENLGDNWHNLRSLCTPVSTRSSERLRKSKHMASHTSSAGARRRSSIIRRKITKSKGHRHSVDLEDLLHNIRNEKLRHLIISKRDAKQQVEQLHKIMREAGNPIAMARPLSSLSNQMVDDSNNNNNNKNNNNNYDTEAIKLKTKDSSFVFSDISDTEDEDEAKVKEKSMETINAKCASATATTPGTLDDVVLPLVKFNVDEMKENAKNCSMNNKRKFFKSGYTNKIPKQVQITDKIRATVIGHGKLCLVPETKKKQKKRRISTKGLQNGFSNEQATVDAILRNLDDSTFGEKVHNHHQLQQQQQKPREESNQSMLNTLNVNDYKASGSMCKPQMQVKEEHQQVGELQQQQQHENDDATQFDNFIEVLATLPEYKKFYERLPYNTNDPEIIKRQYTLLEFLITNNICTEENFTIFIGDPDNHKAEAERIVNELITVIGDDDDDEMQTDDDDVKKEVNGDQRKGQQELEQKQPRQQETKEPPQLPLNECKQMEIVIEDDSNDIEEQQQQQRTVTNMDVANESNGRSPIKLMPNIDTNNLEHQTGEPKKLFPIFLKNAVYKPLPLNNTNRKTTKAQRHWNGGYGINQYQIDAGQKQFGATQCKQCGLLYTMHEPEEEKLHRDFHNSMHLLRFKGWLNEDIVSICPEWSTDGRIVRVTESAPPKQRQRVMDVLNVIDKELGYAAYIMPKAYAAYLAVRKSQIVGLCLVQPLEKANKYICINGVDCCTREEFNVRCGISRLWVAPLHRRLHIASKLLQTIKMNTILGQELPWDQIAFSAPTEMGKIFAQKVTQMENFLVYS